LWSCAAAADYPDMELHVSGTTTQDLADLGEVARRPSLPRAVAAVRDVLGTEVAYLAEHTGDQQIIRILAGDGASFGLAEGQETPLGETYCHRVLSGRLPNVIPDVRADDRARALEITTTARVGAFTSVPVLLSGGRVYGTLCAAAHEAMPALGYRELQMLHVLARLVADRVERDELEARATEGERHAAVASALLTAVQGRDGSTAEGAEATADKAAAVARRLHLDDSEVADVRRLALVHDLGNLSIPDAILHKPGSLTGAEWAVVRTHAAHGARIVAGIPALAHLAASVRAIHERWDGSGYPDGLSAGAIPVGARIVAVCDAWRAMTSDRPHRAALSIDAARVQIEAGLGSQFCPSAGRTFLNVIAGR
jgi:GAF domain-containing protein